MNFLGKLLLDWLWEKLYAFLSGLWKRKQREGKIQKEAESSVEPLKRAETGKEIDDATDDALRKL